MTQPILNNPHLDVLRGASGELRALLEEHRAAVAEQHRRINGDDGLTTQGKADRVREADRTIGQRFQAAQAAIGRRIDAASAALATAEDRTRPKPATGVEALLARQAAWSRSRTLLVAGVRPQQVIAETTDPETLYALLDELPTHMRVAGKTADGIEPYTTAIRRRLSEVAGTAAVTAFDAARQGEVERAAIGPWWDYVAAEIGGQAERGASLMSAVAAVQARHVAAERLLPRTTEPAA